MHIMKASNQWSNRPSDERFWTVQDLHTATLAHRMAAATAKVDSLHDLQVRAFNGEIQLHGKQTNSTADLTHWAFGQLCARADTPAGYLRTLPTELAVLNLNHGLQHAQGDARLLLYRNGGYYVRAVTSQKYTRIWNSDIVSRLLGFENDGWKVAPAYPVGGMFSTRNGVLSEEDKANNYRIATAQDAALSLTIKEGDVIGPAGLYASFEDMFAFMLHPERVIVDGSEGGLMRGFMVWNSEVGKSTFGVSTFYFRGVCGNHIIWDASNVKEINLRHVGNADERAFQGLSVELKRYADESATDIEDKIRYARTVVIKGKTKEEVIDWIFSQRLLTRKDAVKAYDAVNEDVDGPAYTVWGYAQGITRMSQSEPNADTRAAYDRVAGKLLEIVF